MAAHRSTAVTDGSPFGGRLGGGFPTSGEELAGIFEVFGETTAIEANGFRFLSDDRGRGDVLESFRDASSPPATSGSSPSQKSRHYGFFSSDPDFIDYWSKEIAPDDGEICLFVRLIEGSSPAETVFSIGKGLRESFADYLGDDGSAAIRDGLTDFISAEFNRDIKELIESGKLVADTWQRSEGILRFLSYFETLITPVIEILDNLPKGLDFGAVEETLRNSFQNVLISETAKLLKSDKEEELKFSDHADVLYERITGQFSWFLNALPAHDLAAAFFIEQVKLRYADSRMLQMVVANEKFKIAIGTSLLSKDNLSDMLRGNAEAAMKNQQQIGDVAIGGAIVGSTAFVIGTIYQIIFDIVNAFVQIIKYSFKGLNYAYQQASDYLTAEPLDESLAEADPLILGEIFPPIDIEEFLTVTVPEIFSGVVEFASGVIDDFLVNAEKYGKLVGDYLASAMGKTVETALHLFLEKYNPNASILERIWYVIKQWFNAGALLGPILVDIALLFCSGGLAGPVSAATKIAKIDKLSDVFRFAKVGSKALGKFTHLNTIIKKIPPRLVKVVDRLLEQLWQVVGPALNQVKEWMVLAHKSLKGQKELPDLKALSEMVDNWYSRCSTLNFLIAIVLLFTGQSEVNSKGQITLAK